MSTAVLEPPVAATTTATAAGVLQRRTAAGSPQPEWYQTMQDNAWLAFEGMRMPVRTDEAWRFASLKSLDLAGFHAPELSDDADRDSLIQRSVGMSQSAGRMVFANDELLQRQAIGSNLLQRGVIWLPLREAAVKHPDLFQQYFMKEPARLGGRKFAALHQAWASNGTFLYVPRGVEIDLPVEAFHWLDGDGASCFPHTLIVAEEASKVTVLDHFASSSPTGRGFACGVNDLWLGTGAKVTYACVQRWNRQTLNVQINSTFVGRDATALAFNLNAGGQYVRGEAVSHLRGAGGRSDMLSVSVVNGRQEVDQRTLQIHEVPDTASDLLYKNSLDDESRSVFAGLIRVEPGAQRTDAYQKVRNLLLSDEAEANSAPGLEIEADDVRCTHGATSGQVEEEELFYLLSRGITRKDAQRLIVFGFLNEVIERMPDAELQEFMRGSLRG